MKRLHGRLTAAMIPPAGPGGLSTLWQVHHEDVTANIYVSTIWSRRKPEATEGKPDHARSHSLPNVLVGVCTLPGGLGDGAFHVSTPVAGVRNLEQILVLFKYLRWGAKTIEDFVIVDDGLRGLGEHVSVTCSEFGDLDSSAAPTLGSFSSPVVE